MARREGDVKCWALFFFLLLLSLGKSLSEFFYAFQARG